MFIISQYLLKTSGTCKNINQVSTYSIITGLILYASIYLYLLFYNTEYLTIFNKFLIYIIIVDLLLSTFYYFNIHKSFKYSKNEDNSIDIDTYKKTQDLQNLQDLQNQSLNSDESDSDESDSDKSDQEDLQEYTSNTEIQMLDLENLHDQQEDQQEEQLEDQQEDQQEEQLEDQQEDQTEQTQDQTEPIVELNEIDKLLSIPIPVKFKAKRAPRKKKDTIVLL